MRRHVPVCRGQKPLHRPASAGSKVSGPNELFLNYGCERQTSSLGSPPSHYIINPPISPVQQWGKLLLRQFPTRPATPTTPLPFFLQMASTPPRPPSSTLSPLRHNLTRGQTQQHAHTQAYFGVCVWGLSVWHRVLWLCILCAPVRGEEIRGRQTTAPARHNSPYMGRAETDGAAALVKEGAEAFSRPFVSERLQNALPELSSKTWADKYWSVTVSERPHARRLIRRYEIYLLVKTCMQRRRFAQGPILPN